MERVGLTLLDEVTEARGKNCRDDAVVEKEEAERQHDVIQERVVGRENNSDLKGSEDAESGDAEAARQKYEPAQDELGREGEKYRAGVKRVRDLLHVPADPARQRAVLVIVVHGG